MMRNHLVMSFALLGGIVLAPASGNAEGIVTLTFDDSSASQYEYAFPIMQEFGLVGTLYVTTGGVDAASIDPKDERYDPFYMTWDNVRSMHAAGWEIASHGHSHQNLTEATELEQFAEVAYSYRRLSKELDQSPVSYSSPYGAFDERLLRFVKETYTSHVRAWGVAEGSTKKEGFNDKENPFLYEISRLDAIGDLSTDDVCGAVKAAGENQEWLVLMFHQVRDDETGPYTHSTEAFRSIVACIAAEARLGTVSVQTVSDVVSSIREKGEEDHEFDIKR